MPYTTSNAFARSIDLQQAMTEAGVEQRTCSEIINATERAIAKLNHGDLPRWLDALNLLPVIDQSVSARPPPPDITTQLSAPAIKVSISTPDEQVQATFEKSIKAALVGLKPWRKGPFNIAGTYVDTEWRSDLKWKRVSPHLSDLTNRRVLDVGCGNGYYAWRMRAAGARLVIGIDPSMLFMLQFKLVQHFINDQRVQLLPLTLEGLPLQTPVFDTVFSMGVLYHRRDPMNHLQRLWHCLQPDGELILETLMLPGDSDSILRPADALPANAETTQSPSVAPDRSGRYARMRNVWSVPTEGVLHQWLQQAGFSNTRTVDISQTTTDEQRSTDWMPFESLQQALDPENPERTIEGWPAPTRITLLARKSAK